jgi:CheY-like chemotaxis protein
MERFLLIDDDDIIGIVHPAIINQVFPESEVILIKSCMEAFDYFKEQLAANIPAPDVIFLDINLPKMNGFEFLEQLSEKDLSFLKHTQIYMLSSSIDQRDMAKVEANKNITGFIGKPLTMDFIREKFSDNSIQENK